MSLPRIAVTLGDPAGIGPEICLQLLNDRSLATLCIPVVFGDGGVGDDADAGGRYDDPPDNTQRTVP